jgi:uncharacterized protein YciI
VSTEERAGDAPQSRAVRAPATVAAWCLDAPGAAAARRAATPAHLRWVETVVDRIALAGPIYDADGRHMIGSLYVWRTANVEEARAWLASDPFHAAGVWDRIDLRPFLPAAGQYVGGIGW